MTMQQEQSTRPIDDVISSDRVEGTPVYGVDGDHIGSVDKLLIEKRGGKVTDAIISMGGFLGLGAELHSIPWSKLDYDTDVGGYKLDITEDELKRAPTFSPEKPDSMFNREYQNQVYTYYGVPPFW